MHDTRDAQSPIALSPLLVTEVKTSAQLAALRTTLPAVAVFDTALQDNTLGVLLDGSLAAIDSEAATADERVIPAYRVSNLAEAEALGTYAASLSLSDMYVISPNPSLITAARAICDDLYGMIEVSAFDGDSEKLRSETISPGARGVIFQEDAIDRDTISYLQDRYLVVWQTVSDQDISAVTAINNGVLGLVTPDVKATESCFNKYYTQNTLTRTPEIIGHRGVTSLAQENSLAGALKALEVGADMVECDVYLMADGNLVIMHDDTLDRTTTGTGSVTEQTAETPKNWQIDVRTDLDTEPIPLLDDFFENLKSTGKVIVIELKSDDVLIAQPLVDLIQKYDMQQQVLLISFHAQVIAAVRSYDPCISACTLTTSIYADEQRSLDITQEVLKKVIPVNTSFGPSKSRGTVGINYFNDLLARGITAWTFTVDTQSELDAFFVNGARGITTNYSQRAGDYIKSFRAVKDTTGKVTLKAKTYNGGSASLENAELVVIGGEGSYDATSGLVTLTDDAQGFFFRLSETLSNGITYSVVTPVLSLSDSDTAPDYYTATQPKSTLPLNSTDKDRLTDLVNPEEASTELTPTISSGYFSAKMGSMTTANTLRVNIGEHDFAADDAILFYFKGGAINNTLKFGWGNDYNTLNYPPTAVCIT